MPYKKSENTSAGSGEVQNGKASIVRSPQFEKMELQPAKFIQGWLKQPIEGDGD
jgi:hypothetical protein